MQTVDMKSLKYFLCIQAHDPGYINWAQFRQIAIHNAQNTHNEYPKASIAQLSNGLYTWVKLDFHSSILDD